MSGLASRKIQLEVETYVSKCDICGKEEVAECFSYQHERNQDLNAKPRFVGNSYHFKTHGHICASSNAPVIMVPAPDGSARLVSDDKSEWRFCPEHHALMKARISRFVSEERERVKYS